MKAARHKASYFTKPVAVFCECQEHTHLTIENVRRSLKRSALLFEGGHLQSVDTFDVLGWL